MKIAVISDRVYPYFKGGAEKRIWDIASLLTKKGYEFHFYTGQWPGMKRDEIIDGIYLHGVYKDTDYVVMLDGDDTYKSEEILKLIEPLENGFCDVIVGSRLEGKLNDHSLSASHRVANWLFTFFIRRFYLVNTTDTCTGYFAWKKKVINELTPHIKSDGFAIEVEMITKMAKLGYKIYSVPITYDRREGHSKLSPILDGIKITRMLFKNLIWRLKE